MRARAELDRPPWRVSTIPRATPLHYDKHDDGVGLPVHAPGTSPSSLPMALRRRLGVMVIVVSLSCRDVTIPVVMGGGFLAEGAAPEGAQTAGG